MVLRLENGNRTYLKFVYCRTSVPKVGSTLEGGGSILADVDLDGATDMVLGMWFDRKADGFVNLFWLNRLAPELLNGNRVPSKREALRVLAAYFDSGGRLVHFVVHLWILLQHAWRTRGGWEKLLPDDLHGAWFGSPQILKLQKLDWPVKDFKDLPELKHDWVTLRGTTQLFRQCLWKRLLHECLPKLLEGGSGKVKYGRIRQTMEKTNEGTWKRPVAKLAVIILVLQRWTFRTEGGMLERNPFNFANLL